MILADEYLSDLSPNPLKLIGMLENLLFDSLDINTHLSTDTLTVGKKHVRVLINVTTQCIPPDFPKSPFFRNAFRSISASP